MLLRKCKQTFMMLCGFFLAFSLIDIEIKHLQERYEEIQRTSQLHQDISQNRVNSTSPRNNATKIIQNIEHQVSPAIKRDFWINCNNVAEIKIEKKIGFGFKKEVYLGDFRGTKVIVKVLRNTSSAIQDCLKIKGIRTDRCYDFNILTTVNEILLNIQLEHPGLVRLLGYCVRDVLHPPTEDIVAQRGVISVFEVGQKYDPNNFKTLSERLRVAYQLADLLDYLDHSPVGSLFMSDLEHVNFVMIDGQIKLSDIDRMNSKPRLRQKGKEWKEFKGFHMMEKAVQVMFPPLLRADKSGYMKAEVEHILSKLKENKLTAAQLKDRLRKLDPALR